MLQASTLLPRRKATQHDRLRAPTPCPDPLQYPSHDRHADHDPRRHLRHPNQQLPRPRRAFVAHAGVASPPADPPPSPRTPRWQGGGRSNGDRRRGSPHRPRETLQPCGTRATARSPSTPRSPRPTVPEPPSPLPEPGAAGPSSAASGPTEAAFEPMDEASVVRSPCRSDPPPGSQQNDRQSPPAFNPSVIQDRDRSFRSCSRSEREPRPSAP
jgi:hypothetical protein